MSEFKSKYKLQSIGKEQAIELAKTKWWKEKTAEEIVFFQLFTVELAMDFSDFHEALEKCLGRPVFTHELGVNFDGICDEFLGNKEAPNFKEIIKMIQKQKKIIIGII